MVLNLMGIGWMSFMNVSCCFDGCNLDKRIKVIVGCRKELGCSDGDDSRELIFVLNCRVMALVVFNLYGLINGEDGIKNSKKCQF
jgi:hypothetical protein